MIGYPALSIGEYSITLTRGQIAGRADEYLKTDAKLTNGNSGGPVVDTNGNFVGIATGTTTEGLGIGLVIPIALISDLIRARSSFPSYTPKHPSENPSLPAGIYPVVIKKVMLSEYLGENNHVVRIILWLPEQMMRWTYGWWTYRCCTDMW